MTRELTPAAARRLRAQAQLLDGSDLDPAAVVHRAAALQGQDLPAVLRAIALRSRPGTGVSDVRAAFDTGAVVRSWPMRGTLFATTRDHLAALLHHTADRMHRAAARRREQLGLDDRAIGRARDVLAAALAERPLTRAAAMARCTEEGLDATGGRGYHLLHHLAVEGLLHWGPFAEGGTEQLLVLSGPPPAQDPDAALADVVRGFVAARGPVTEADLAWWTKLPLTVLRRALAAVDDLVPVSIAGLPAFVVGEPAVPGRGGVTLVPAFDEWILGYADRSLVATPAVLDELVPGGNGVFRPAVLVDGVVVGTWRLVRGAGGALPRAEVALVEPVPAATRRAIDRAVVPG